MSGNSVSITAENKYLKKKLKSVQAELKAEKKRSCDLEEKVSELESALVAERSAPKKVFAIDDPQQRLIGYEVIRNLFLSIPIDWDTQPADSKWTPGNEHFGYQRSDKDPTDNWKNPFVVIPTQFSSTSFGSRFVVKDSVSTIASSS